jgi:hypothetical protein
MVRRPNSGEANAEGGSLKARFDAGAKSGWPRKASTTKKRAKTGGHRRIEKARKEKGLGTE